MHFSARSRFYFFFRLCSRTRHSSNFETVAGRHFTVTFPFEPVDGVDNYYLLATSSKHSSSLTTVTCPPQQPTEEELQSSRTATAAPFAPTHQAFPQAPW